LLTKSVLLFHRAKLFFDDATPAPRIGHFQIPNQ
jgi:hypothetical protein